jgi:pentatricopeptide repeat protein
MELLYQMQQEGIIPDRFTFVSVINAYASLRAHGEGRRIHTAQIIQRGCDSDLYVNNAHVCKCASLEDAWRVLNEMPTRKCVQKV